MNSSDVNRLISDNHDLFNLYLCTQAMKEVSYDRFGRVCYQDCSWAPINEPLISYALCKDNEIEYPGQHKFAATITHDVDFLFPSWKYLLYKGLTDKNFFFSILKARKRTFLHTLSQIIKLEESLEGKSTFYFLVGADLFEKPSCSFEQITKKLEEIVTLLSDNGFEIGLHTSYYKNSHLNLILDEKNMLEKLVNHRVRGVRIHYLRFREPETWQVLCKAGFDYDTTYAFPDTVGFRNGLCHPFRPFDLQKQENIQIWEVPLIFSDSAVMNYLKLSPREAWEVFVDLLRKIKETHGVLNMLLHPATYDLYYFTWKKFYKALLQKLRSEGAWITSVAELIGYWNKSYGERNTYQLLKQKQNNFFATIKLSQKQRGR